jgi:hypothetical protein
LHNGLYPKILKFKKINMGIIEDPKYFKLNVDLEGMVAIATEGLL